MIPYVVKKLPFKEVAPGIRLRPIHLDKLTVTFVDIDDGAVLPEHSHPHEQITHIVKGTLRMLMDGKEYDISEGEVMAIPGGVPHSAVTVGGPVTEIDAFSPRRDDYVIE